MKSIPGCRGCAGYGSADDLEATTVPLGGWSGSGRSSRTALGGANFSKMAVFERFFSRKSCGQARWRARGFRLPHGWQKAVTAPLLCGDRRHQRLDAEDIHYPREIVGEHMQRHFGGDLWQRLHQKVRCPHARLHGPERVLGSLASHTHSLRLFVEPPLHRFRDMLVLPARDAALPLVH